MQIARGDAATSTVKCLGGIVLAIVISGCEPDLPALPDPSLAKIEPISRPQIVAARRTVENNPKDAEANGRLGMLYSAYSLDEAALVCFERAIHLAPQEYRWSFLAAHTAHLAGRPDQALQWSRRAIELQPDSVFTILKLGRLQLNTGLLQDARKSFERALAIDPAAVAALQGLGEVAMK